MSSGHLVIPNNSESFWWNENLDQSQYFVVTYRISTSLNPEIAAIGMAMEQSASTQYIQGYVEDSTLDDWTIRISSIIQLDDGLVHSVADQYFLQTEVYHEQSEGTTTGYDIVLAIPNCLVQNRPSQLLNVIVGELPRLGFLTSFTVIDIQLPLNLGPGPAFGSKGILKLLEKESGPLLCRAMRPGIGLDTQVMSRLNRDVLIGGFHLVKDDELICFPDHSSFATHLRAMILARNEAIQQSGEKKLYLANLICEHEELQQRWDTACELGVDGVLVAPFIQGLGAMSWLAKQKVLPILAHNSFADLLTRNTNWGLDNAVLCTLVRYFGADWFVTPGIFGSDLIDPLAAKKLMLASRCNSDKLPALMPNIQGGKHPGDLDTYYKAVQHTDFMLIVAHWVDSHPLGLQQAARIFRSAVDRLNSSD